MNDIDRREFGAGLSAFAALIAAGAFSASTTAQERPLHASSHDMPGAPASWRGREKIVFLIYPGFTALDMVGPHYMLTNLMGTTTQVVAKTMEPVRSDTGLMFSPSARFEDAFTEIDILCVPGGADGTLAAMRDEATVAFIRKAGGKARFVTSVCTGSILLGAAGLLDGYKATSHWITKPLLPIFGAVPADGRFVRDRNRITAEGVTAGLDFGLSLVAELRDRTYAEAVQLLAQYAPEPPFDAGEPERAPKAAMNMLEQMFAGFVRDMMQAGREAYVKSRKL
ncbi:MAG: DJ-1/PfpI family protein [Methylocystaceae bacterium]|nr:MAG: DJ-1/PfpI family protein [Methylocystaceae bacterium]